MVFLLVVFLAEHYYLRIVLIYSMHACFFMIIKSYSTCMSPSMFACTHVGKEEWDVWIH